MTENVTESLEVRQDIQFLLVTARDGVTALETASTLIHIPTRDMAKIQTAIKKMREAALYIENRAYNIPVKSNATTKSAIKEALKDASQEQIERAYAILSGKESAEGGAMAEDADYEVPEGGDEE